MLTTSPLIVSNNILELAFREGIPVTPMKLQKLLYFLYREYLKKTKEPLFSERFEAWKYGPVLPSVYSQFSSYRDKKIDKYYEDSNGKSYKIRENVNDDFYEVLFNVWCKYKMYDGIALSNITHREGSAWRKAWLQGDSYLHDGDIANEVVG